MGRHAIWIEMLESAGDVRSLRLHELSTQLLQATDTQALYEQILDTAVQLMGAPIATVQLLDRSRNPDGELRLLRHRGLSPEAAALWTWIAPSRKTACGIAMHRQARVIIPDVTTDEVLAIDGDQAAFAKENIRATQTTPLFSRNGELLGMLSTHWPVPHTPSEHDLELLDIIVRQAAYLIERHLLEDALRRSAALDAFRIRFSDALRSSSDPAQIKAVAASLLGPQLAVNRVVYTEIFENHAVIECDYVSGVPSIAGHHPLASGSQHIQTQLRAGRRVVIDDISTDPQLSDADRATYDGFACHSLVVVPLIKKGVWVGAVAVHSSPPRRWTPDELWMIEYTGERTWEAVDRARAEAALRDADRNKDLFLAMLAHELRNPLAPVRTGIEVIRLSKNPEDIERMTAIMQRQVDHVVRLVDDLLDASRITQGKIVLQREPTALSEIVDVALETSRPQIADAHLELEVRIPEQPCVLDVDPTRIVQVLSNLLHNATKFTAPGGRIVVEATVRDERVTFAVTDTGEGVPHELLPRMFDLFAQGERPNQPRREGLGLGLALARLLVELHGGTIDARSDGPGCGTQFLIQLPLREAVATAATIPDPDVPAPMRSAREVVIVDDNRDAANALAALVQTTGARAHVAYDGVTGIERVREVRPDVVLLDIGMPGVDGYEACRRIRLEPHGQDIMIVAVSGWGQPKDKHRAIAAGFTAHITKPAELAELRRYLESVTA